MSFDVQSLCGQPTRVGDKSEEHLKGITVGCGGMALTLRRPEDTEQRKL
jgi:hypothetical protein